MVPPLLGIDAVANARIVVLRSPIEGKIENGMIPVGAEPVAGQETVAIRNDRRNVGFSGELKTERESLTRRITSLDEQSAASAFSICLWLGRSNAVDHLEPAGMVRPLPVRFDS